MGHLTSVANALVQNSEKGPNAEQLQQLLKGEGGAHLGAGGAGGASVLTSHCPHIALPLPAELPQEQRERWEAFVSGPLAETNKKNTVDLVSQSPAPVLLQASHPQPRSPSLPQASPGAPQALTPAGPCPGEHAPPALLQR